MSAIYFNCDVREDSRRKRLYNGEIYIFSARPSTMALRDFARRMIEEAFGAIDPLEAQYHITVEQYVAIAALLKPRFIHHPQTIKLLRAVVEEFGCELETTYVDVPRLRMVTSDGYLTAGVGYIHPPHRDTWYSAPMAQLNWWMPIYDIEAESSLAFHPRYWNEPVKNSSRNFNYYEWNAHGRKQAAQHVKTDTRKQPRPEQEMQLEPQIRCVVPSGGVVLFSAAQMHSTVPNTSGRARYSIDFRTVDIKDVAAMSGPRNLDSQCSGTSLRDFLRAEDFAPMAEEVIKLHDTDMPVQGELVYRPE